MSPLKIYMTIPFAFAGFSFSQKLYHIAKRWSIPKDKKMQAGEALKNLVLLAEATPKELSSRVCSLSVKTQSPFLNQFNTGSANQKDLAKKNARFSSLAGLATGLTASAVLVSYMFGKCLSQKGVGYCMNDLGDSLVDNNLGIALLVGTFTIARLSSNLFYTPWPNILSGNSDWNVQIRTDLLTNEYKQLSEHLVKLADRQSNDPDVEKNTKLLAQKLLRNIPAIKNELHQGVAISRDEIEKIVYPLEAISRQILLR